MIVLDTNVVSELMKREAGQNVIDWLDGQITDGVFITSVTAAELLHGVQRLPNGQRKARLAHAVGELLDIEFGGRILPFDALAAVEYARVLVDRSERGLPVSMADAMIAATALASGVAAVATRNTADFDHTGVEVVDPWTAPPMY